MRKATNNNGSDDDVHGNTLWFHRSMAVVELTQSVELSSTITKITMMMMAMKIVKSVTGSKRVVGGHVLKSDV